MTTTPERERQNRDIPESKASFVAYKVKNDLQECWSQWVFLNFTPLEYSFDEAWWFNTTCHWQEKVLLILVIFNCLFECVLASERNEMVENWLMTFFSLTCPGLTFTVKKIHK